MIIVRAPLRVSFAGGGSDIPEYFKNSEEPGVVVSTAIQKYVYVYVSPKFDGGIRVSYSRTENVNNVSEIQHDIIREALKMFEISKGIEVVTMADVSGRGTGLGSSSALAVALVAALSKYTGKYYNRYNCAEMACKLEIEKCKHPIGYQDQFASAFGGLNRIEFRKRETRVDKIEPFGGTTVLQDNLILFWTGIRSKTSDDILREQTAGLSDASKKESTKTMAKMADDLNRDIWAGNIDHFGRMLNEGWKLKKTMSSGISNPKIDKIYQKALESGATGGKLLGAGGGGFLLLFASPDRHAMLRNALSLKSIPIKFDTKGVSLIHYG
jgi:D-glycero-alpha-D-manno-heptose-7-phosphate kinase